MEEIVEIFLDVIKENNIFHQFNVDKKEVYIRCPYCGDSGNEYHAHLYIKLNIDSDEPLVYFCQICNNTGIIDKDFLILIQVDDSEFQKEITQHNRNANKKKKSNNKIFKRKELIIPKFEKTKSNLKKISYLENRLNIKLDIPNDIYKYKIIWNFYDFLLLNKINYLTNNNQKFMDYVNSNSIGFLSCDNKTIIFRNIGNKFENFRYYNYTIYNIYNNIYNYIYYIIYSEVNLLNNYFEIILSEGIIDIIGIFNHIYNKEISNNRIYIAVNGNNYKSALLYLFQLGLVDMDIKIYSDTDKPLSKYEYIAEEISHINFNPIEIFYNRFPNEKDYGIPKNKIKLEKYLIEI